MSRTGPAEFPRENGSCYTKTPEKKTVAPMGGIGAAANENTLELGLIRTM